MLSTNHIFCAVDGKRDFIVYNSTEKLNDDEILDNDLMEINISGDDIQKLRSEAWSSGCRYFFILQPYGIYLCKIFDTKSWICRKKSIQFIEMYLNYKKENHANFPKAS